ncbi:ABC transporter substrate-binding protein [Candidatus Nomurabacteria bacterium]|uniref:Thiamine pyrimidine synthase n=1 Tax=Candidatus Dojkabacteria bacterium TaxID=2099670 RepID=A0A955KXV4_9BACT|nr:ABC transporter substrate-binding protein [Candidatus Dojkabacteria bacterium]MCB9790051.1 ABC transporter substrate-binding protein [Candidatus Nomurabacteria bacterium]
MDEVQQVNEKVTEKKNNFPILIIGALLVLVLGYFLFSGNEKADKDDAEKKLDPVVLQLKWIPQAQFAGYLVADAKGYYEDEGIDLQIMPGGVGINPVDVLIADEADIAVAWTGNVLPAISKGEDLVNIGQGFQRSGLRMMAWKDSGIVEPADIAGKKIGTWPGGNELEPYAFIEKQDLDKDRDVELVSQGFDMNQLINKEIDLASAMIYNEYWLPIEAGYGEDEFVVFDLNEEGAAMLQDALFVKRDFLDNNEDLLVRFLRATMKGWDYAITNPVEAVDLMGLDFTENDVTAKDHQIRSMYEVAKLTVADDGTAEGLFFIDRDKLEQTVTIAETYVDEVKDIDLDKIYTLDIWKNAVEGMEFSDYSKVAEY